MPRNNRRTVDNSSNHANVDIINAIRNSNLSLAAEIPAADGTRENLVKIGEIIEGTPAFLQHFTSLLTQIAAVRISSRVFDEYYTQLIKGDIEYGGMVEEAFVNVTRARDFAPAKANEREFQRVRPDIERAFHKMNWQSQYTATVDRVDIRKAFRSETGVVDLVEKIVGTLRSSANLDHKLLVEYMIKRSMLNGAISAETIGNGEDLTDMSIANRAAALRFAMPTRKFNAKGVYTHTPREAQWLVVDADTYAEYDVSVLANAFNMDKADLLGRMIVIDRWDEFDYERFGDLNDAHKQLENFSPDETEKLTHVRGVLIDEEAFQIYNLTNATSDQWSASGLHTNYFLTIERIYSMSPFSNAIAFVEDAYAPGDPDTVTGTVDSVSQSAQSTVVTFSFEVPVGKNGNVSLSQTKTLTDGKVLADGGELVFSTGDGAATKITPSVTVGSVTLDGTEIDVTKVKPANTITFDKKRGGDDA